MFVCLSVWVLVPAGARRRSDLLKLVLVTGRCKSPDMTAGNWTQVFWKSSKCSLLSNLFISLFFTLVVLHTHTIYRVLFFFFFYCYSYVHLPRTDHLGLNHLCWRHLWRKLIAAYPSFNSRWAPVSSSSSSGVFVMPTQTRKHPWSQSTLLKFCYYTCVCERDRVRARERDTERERFCVSWKYMPSVSAVPTLEPLGTGVTGTCELPDVGMGTKLIFFAREVCTFNHCTIYLSSLISSFC